MKYILIALALVVVAVIVWFVTRKPSESAVAVTPTYDGPIEQYSGGKTLLVALHARWASVWPATADALSKVDRAKYDIKLIDADQNKQAVQDLGVKIIPTVIVYRDGKEVTRLPNMMSLDQLP
jgi:thioredoxin-like negative regulator of GroEL